MSRPPTTRRFFAQAKGHNPEYVWASDLNGARHTYAMKRGIFSYDVHVVPTVEEPAEQLRWIAAGIAAKVGFFVLGLLSYAPTFLLASAGFAAGYWLARLHGGF